MATDPLTKCSSSSNKRIYTPIAIPKIARKISKIVNLSLGDFLIAGYKRKPKTNKSSPSCL
jgi:hypothetical protein